MMKKIILQPMGLVSSLITERMNENWGKTESKIILNAEYSGALLGLENFPHAIIVTYLPQVHYKKKHL